MQNARRGREDERASGERTVLTVKAERIRLTSARGGRLPAHYQVAPTFKLGEKGNSDTFKAEGKSEKAKWERVVGLVQVSVYDKEGAYGYGDRIRVRGSLRKPPLPENPGQFDYRSYLARKGIYALMTVYQKGQIEFLGIGRVNPFVKVALLIKDKMRAVIKQTLQYPQDVLLAGILLGERWGVPQELKEVFTQTGTAHILAISGLHVGLVVGRVDIFSTSLFGC